MNGLMNEPITEIDLENRTCNVLMRAGIETVGELSELSINDLIKVRGLGRRALDDILERLAENGIVLQ